MQFSFERKPKPASPDQNIEQSSADERLRKAIERNRAKMQSRQGNTQSRAPQPQGMSANSLRDKLENFSENKSNTEEQSLLEKMRARRAEASGKNFQSNLNSNPLPSRPNMSDNIASTRKVITDPDKIELAGNLRKGPAPSSAVVTYTANEAIKSPVKKSVSAKRKVKTKSRTERTSIADWFVKGAWMFCLFLVARLIFSQGGVIDYFDKKSTYQSKVAELEYIKNENINLMNELELMKSDGRYQKKLVRDHLGYIANDEYLILFSKSSDQSEDSGEVSSI